MTSNFILLTLLQHLYLYAELYVVLLAWIVVPVSYFSVFLYFRRHNQSEIDGSAMPAVAAAASTVVAQKGSIAFTVEATPSSTSSADASFEAEHADISDSAPEGEKNAQAGPLS